MMTIPPHEVSWRLLEEAEDRQPHRPYAMQLASRSLMFAWLCPWCRDLAYSTTTLRRPVCHGGLRHRVWEGRDA